MTTPIVVDVVVPAPPAVIEASIVLPVGPPGPAGPPGPSGADTPHHANHEPGGSDPIAALSADVLTTGTLPNGRLAANVVIGSGVASSLAVGGPTTTATTGTIRVPNNTPTIMMRNQANDADLPVITAELGNHIKVGGVWRFHANGTFLPTSGDNTADIGAIGARVRSIYCGTNLNAAAAIIGTSPATVGHIRLPNIGSIFGRNAANNADVPMLSIDAVNQIVIAVKVKAGTPVDADFTTPRDGLLVIDTTASKLWARVGGAWKSTALA